MSEHAQIKRPDGSIIAVAARDDAHGGRFVVTGLNARGGQIGIVGVTSRRDGVRRIAKAAYSETFRIVWPDPQDIRDAVLRTSTGEHCHKSVRAALARYAEDGDPEHLAVTVFRRTRNRIARERRTH